MEFRLGREINEVMRGVREEKVVGSMECRSKCKNNRPEKLKVEIRKSSLKLRFLEGV